MRSGSTQTAEPSMRRWLRTSAASAGRVADEPELWLAGALAWLTTLGWIPFVVAVVRPPTIPELTYFGSGLWTSGLWPFNVIGLAAAVVALVVLALALASGGNAVLVASAEGRRASMRDAGRLLVTALLGAAPVALCVLVVAIATVAVGPVEFNRPGETNPVLRVVMRLAPLLVFGAVVAVAASTLSGLTGRAAMREESVARGLTATPALVNRAGRAVLWHIGASAILGLLYLVLCGLLLSVLWAPIGARLDIGAPLDLANGLLLVGFVAIWLCLVLAGGAIHAWASVTATTLLGGRTSTSVAERSQEMLLDR